MNEGAVILETGLVSIDEIKPYKGNPRVGNVEVIRESLRKNGLYRPVVVWEQTGEILAGNHTWKAAKAEGYTEIQRTLVQCDTDTAKRINLVDNRAPELGGYDEEALLELLGSIPELEGTGWTETDRQDLVDKLGPVPDELGGSDDIPDDDYASQLGVIVLCDDQQQQQAVFETLQKEVAKGGTFSGTELKVVAV